MRTVRSSASLLLAFAGMLALLSPAAASAVPEWAPTVNFPVPASDRFEGNPFMPPEVAYQAGGIANEIFLEIQSLSPLTTTLHIGTMAPGGSYSDQLAIPSSEGAVPTEAAIAVAPNGAAVAAWVELTEAKLEAPFRYRAAYRPAGTTTWEAPVTVATDSEHNKVPSTVIPVIGSDGSAAVAVAHVASGELGSGQKEPVVRVDVVAHRGGGWQPTVRITPEKVSVETPAVTTDGHGNLTVAYAQRFSEGATPEPKDDRYTVVVRRLPAASGVWGPEEDISGIEFNHSADAVRLGEDEAGDAVLAYQFGQVAVSFNAWAVTRQGSNGPWTTPAQVVTAPSSSPTAAGVAPNGTAYILYRYEGSGSGEDCGGVLRGPTGGGFGTQRCISPTNLEVSSGSIAFLGNDAYFAWKGNVPAKQSNDSVQGGRWADGNPLPDVAHNLDPAGSQYEPPALVPDDQGSVVAFYRTSEPGQLRAAAYDGGPPILLGAAVPTTALVGHPVTFSAAFVDLWSGLGGGQPTWSFGDGSVAVAGSAATHTFGAPGSYTVTLDASDILGNATSSTYTLTVTKPPAAGLSPPTVTGFTQSHRVWRAGNARARISAGGQKKLPVGTVFAFSVDEQATVSLRFTHRVGGRLIGHKCVAPSRKNAKRKRCRRTVTVGVLSFTAHAGRNTIAFAGRISHSVKLQPGSYKVSLVATNAAGRKPSVPTLAFTVVR
jgi:hypothetical protein